LERTAAAGGFPIDTIDLHIMRLLSANCRAPYRNIASTVGISTNAAKTRVKKMLAKGVIQKFIVVVNAAIFGYEKECILILRNVDKINREQEGQEEGYIFNQLNLLGDVRYYVKQLGGGAIFSVLLRPGAEDKIKLMNNLLKPAIVEYRFIMINPPSINVSITDLKIMKCLSSNARMEIADIAKEASISPRTAIKRIEKMQQHHIIDFHIIRDMSSMNLSGYIEFLLMVDVNKSAYGEIIESMYSEMQEYLISIPISGNELIIALFFLLKYTYSRFNRGKSKIL
jgi:DNA-binding Lrp family transcriptional regulator